MKRFSTLILISFLLFVSCDDGTKYVEGQLKQYNFSELIYFVKTNAGEWSKKSGVKLALSGLSREYYNDVQVRQFFETEIYEGSSELIQEYGIGAIISNCDTSSIMKVFKQVAQTSNKDDLTSNDHLQKMVLGFEGKVCSDVEQMVFDFKINFLRANSIIDSLENEISLLIPSMLTMQKRTNRLNDKVAELDRPRTKNRCFIILKKQDTNVYEALKLRERSSSLNRSYYPQNKGSMDTPMSEVYKEHVIIISSSGEIEGKGLVCLDVSEGGTTPVTTVDGFDASWDVYREVDLEILESQKMDYFKQANKLRRTLKEKQTKVNQLNSEIINYKMKGEKYSGFEYLAEEKNTGILKSVSRIPMPPVSRDEVAVIETDFGRIIFTFDLDNAPTHASNFKRLVYANYYDGTTFHRVISGFMIQGGDINSRDGDPTNDGIGGPGYTIEAEIHNSHRRGAVAAARTSGPTNPERRSSGSQFYICHVDIPHLDGLYTVFGQVIEGMDVVDKIAAVNTDQNDRPINDVVMNKVYLTRMSEL